MRYNSLDHLKGWQESRAFPNIHHPVTSMFCTEVTGRRVLDLGCCHGLLGARLLERKAADVVIGVDADAAAIAAARAAGVPVAFNHLKVERSTFLNISELITLNRLDVVLARRIIPELFGADLNAGIAFSGLLADAGIKELILEGRASSSKAVNSLSSIDREVALFKGRWAVKASAGAVRYLQAR